MLRIKVELLPVTDRNCRNKEDFNRENSKYSQQKSGRKARTECHSASFISVSSALRRKQHSSLPCSSIRIRHYIKPKCGRLGISQLFHSAQCMPNLHVTYTPKVQINCSYSPHRGDFHKATKWFQYHSRGVTLTEGAGVLIRKHSILESSQLT